MLIHLYDVPDREIKRLLNWYKGEYNLRKQIREFAEELDNELNDIILSDEDRSLKRRKISNLLWDTIDRLREMGEQR